MIIVEYAEEQYEYEHVAFAETLTDKKKFRKWRWIHNNSLTRKRGFVEKGDLSRSIQFHKTPQQNRASDWLNRFSCNVVSIKVDTLFMSWSSELTCLP